MIWQVEFYSQLNIIHFISATNNLHKDINVTESSTQTEEFLLI